MLRWELRLGKQGSGSRRRADSYLWEIPPGQLASWPWFCHLPGFVKCAYLIPQTCIRSPHTPGTMIGTAKTTPGVSNPITLLRRHYGILLGLWTGWWVWTRPGQHPCRSHGLGWSYPALSSPILSPRLTSFSALCPRHLRETWLMLCWVQIVALLKATPWRRQMDPGLQADLRWGKNHSLMKSESVSTLEERLFAFLFECARDSFDIWWYLLTSSQNNVSKYVK